LIVPKIALESFLAIAYTFTSVVFSFFTEEPMPRAYSLDLRERVLKVCDSGLSSEHAAKKYSVSPSWGYAHRNQRRETGSIAPKDYPHGTRPKLEPYEQEIRQLVADHADATLVELHALLPTQAKNNVTVVTLHNFLKRLKITWKKRLFALPNTPETMSSTSGKNGNRCKKSST
jgi:transposase